MYSYRLFWFLTISLWVYLVSNESFFIDWLEIFVWSSDTVSNKFFSLFFSLFISLSFCWALFSFSISVLLVWDNFLFYLYFFTSLNNSISWFFTNSCSSIFSINLSNSNIFWFLAFISALEVSMAHCSSLIYPYWYLYSVLISNLFFFNNSIHIIQFLI